MDVDNDDTLTRARVEEESRCFSVLYNTILSRAPETKTNTNTNTNTDTKKKKKKKKKEEKKSTANRDDLIWYEKGMPRVRTVVCGGDMGQ